VVNLYNHKYASSKGILYLRAFKKNYKISYNDFPYRCRNNNIICSFEVSHVVPLTIAIKVTFNNIPYIY
jgi:hypothetical protein